jgi:hypothetical protein
MKVLGFINRLREYPAPLVTIGQEGDRFFAVYPSGEVVRLIDMTTIEDLRAQAPQNFVPTSPLLLSANPTQLISFAFNRDHIVTADRKRIRDTIRQEISRTRASQDRDILVHYAEELTRLPRVSADTLERTLQNRGDVQVLFTDRLRKSRDRSSSRQDRLRPVLIVQRVSASGTKTLYSRGLPSHTANIRKWFGPPTAVSSYLSRLALEEPSVRLGKRIQAR